MNDFELKLRNKKNNASGRQTNGVRKSLKKLINRPVLLLLIVAFLYFTINNRQFLSINNFITLFVANAYFAIAAIGELMVILTGGIDLSLGHILSASAVISAVLINKIQHIYVNNVLNPGGELIPLARISSQLGVSSEVVSKTAGEIAIQSLLVGLVSALLVGLIFGFVNGICIGKFGMTPFIVTLSTQLIAGGTALVLSNKGRSIGNLPRILTRLSTSEGIVLSSTIIIPWVVIISIVLIIIWGIVLSQTNWGRYVVLIGSNVKSAKFAGLPVFTTLFSVYVFAGLLAGLGGYISLMVLGAGDPDVGDPLLLPIIGSVILGGVDMNGGKGTMVDAGLGILLFAIIINGMTFMNLSLSAQQIVLGIVMAVGMTITALINKKRI